ncbi:hypothetical protein NDA11_007868 [Ustilago hordei]|uniref:Uncharacterized protein n=1 Tax=Ustilago hordei TaxID=120017 RepID=I2FQH7_USTHO|nr:uncharacterized protein UHO2_05259 [Ustilago hordei]KAJ1042854.1 hypothetical protein NDA10_003693 [Ustilago hordei]KAJ1596182.1 hypothetical protein NDA11_007868 [Ustilago hordei]CCF49170.1 uncharacterized protein UHOR_07548 [Ustilago hordei]SYW80700.1 uncharacterized protein UHO2_05259 [Ustilago hordei]
MSARSNDTPLSSSPKRKAAAQTQSKIGSGFSGLCSPKFSFRAALVQHKASKLACKPAAPLAGETSVDMQPISSSVSQDSKLARPIIRTAASSIPSLSNSARNRTNSTALDSSTLPRRRNASTSPEERRAASSLGKRPVEEMVSMACVSDFGALLPKTQGGACKNATAMAGVNRSKLPGPPSARTAWNGGLGGLVKMAASPSMSKVARKVARSDAVGEVHASISPNTSSTSSRRGASPAETRIASRNRTISGASSRSVATVQRPKIATLPKPKARQVPAKTLLHERPQGLLLSGMSDAEQGSGSESDQEDEQEEEENEGEALHVSPIRTKPLVAAEEASKTLPSSAATTAASGSRIPSIGSSSASARVGMRPHRRSSSNSVTLAQAGEKENLSHNPAKPVGLASKRHSMGPGFNAQSRPRSSLALAITQSSCHPPKASQVAIAEDPAATPPPASPTKTCLSTLRSRSQQQASGTDNQTAKQGLGIKSSIISANPIHPSILALQSTKVAAHQPISTPEALIKAKKRWSAVLLSSSGSTCSLASARGVAGSSSEIVSSLGRSQSASTRLGALQKKAAQSTPGKPQPPTAAAEAAAAGMVSSGSRSPIKSSLLLFPCTEKEAVSPLEKHLPTATAAAGEVSASEIDANLLASLKVVAGKANLDVHDLLHQKPEPGVRARSEASQDLDPTFGDVSVDLMALDLANSSPVSDTSMLLSSAAQVGYLDTPPSALARTNATQLQAEQEREQDTSCASPSLRAAAASTLLRRTEVAETPIRRGGGVGVAGYRNVPSIPSTPIPSTPIPSTPIPTTTSTSTSTSPCKCPRSAGMSAKTRMRLKKALRESLGMEAHFATLNFNPSSSGSNAQGEEKIQERKKEMQGDGGDGIGKSPSTMLLTDDDKYLDELVSAVARIGLDDMVGDQHTASPLAPPTPTEHERDMQANNSDAAQEKDASELQTHLSSALAELDCLRSALALSQCNTTTLETQLAHSKTAVQKSTRTQHMLQSDLTALQSQIAAVERDKAKSSWTRARTEALSELQDVKVQADAILVLGSQIELWEALVRASM